MLNMHGCGGLLLSAHINSCQAVCRSPKILGFLLTAFLIVVSSTISWSQTTTVTFNTSNPTWPVPAGVTKITVQVWGAGGGGADKSPNGNDGGGGGGGGGFRGGVLTVTPGNTLAIVVGTGGNSNATSAGGNGGASSVTHTSGSITANGGAGGARTNGGGAGGAGGGGTFTGGVTSQVAYNGAAGGAGDDQQGGGGGGGAGSSGAGSVGGNPTAGTGGTGSGGNGGAGGNRGAGTAGSTYGGGGGGAGDNGTNSGGDGAVGFVSITYTLPNTTGLTVLVQACTGNGAVITLSSSNLQTDTYTITYNITGAGNAVASTTASMTFTTGTPGSSSFVTSTLPVSEAGDVLNITRITNSAGNFVAMASATGFATAACRVWYSYQSGNFGTASTWTLDPSGTTFDNVGNLTPGANDEITILNGITVTYSSNNSTLTSTTIKGGGILDLVATTGHFLGTVTGSGNMRVKSATLPTGNFTDFVSSSGGTIEYYDIGGTLSTTQTTYNNLKMTNSTTTPATYTLVSDMIINGNLSLSTTNTGTVTWQINNNTNFKRTIILYGSLSASANGRITVGSGNEASGTPHEMTIYGGITNDGIIKFFYTGDALELQESVYGNTSTTNPENIYTNELEGNAVNVTFAGTTDQIIDCNNTTDFYRLIVNKGSGQQSMLTVDSNGANNMRLFGPANLGGTSSPSDNSLSIVNGTLQLKGTLTIPILCVNGAGPAGNDYLAIPSTGALWINSSNVSVTVADNTASNDDQRLMVNGTLKVSSGTLKAGTGRGLGSDTGGVIIIEGGTVSAWQYRPILGSQNVSYVQTGGSVYIGTTSYGGTLATAGPDDNGTQAYARFSIPSATSSFRMSGGDLYIGSPYDGTAVASGLHIESNEGNYSVSGGTIHAYIPSGAAAALNDFTIYSTAPLQNLRIYDEGATGSFAAILNNELTVLGDLTLVSANSPSFYCGTASPAKSLTVGGSFEIQSNCTFRLGFASTDDNLLTFNGTGAQTWTHSGTITNLTNVVMNKASGTLMLSGTANFPNISDSFAGLTLTSGTLNDNGKPLTVTSALSNSATHTTGAGGGITYSMVNGIIGGTNGTFGNLTLSGANSVVTASGSQTVSGNLALTGATRCVLDIGSNNWRVNGTITSTVALGHNAYIQTSGTHNAGGLTRPVPVTTDVVFPVGVPIPGNNIYTPATIRIGSATATGTVTVRPVYTEHPNVATLNVSLAFYWRVTSSGYTGLGTVEHKTYQFNDATQSATRNGTQNQYIAARYDRSTNRWSNSTAAGQTMATTLLPTPLNTNVGWTGSLGTQLDGEYTCGMASAFDNTNLRTYYSQAAGGNWNANATWYTISALGVTTNPATSNPTSCPTCPVVIGDGTATTTVTIPTGLAAPTLAEMCGSLTVNTNATLDCGTNATSDTALGFGIGTDGAVTGKGTLRLSSSTGTCYFPSGDFSGFLSANGGTIEYYTTGANNFTIPTSYRTPTGTATTVVTNIVSYYNVVVNPGTSRTVTMPPTNLTIYSSFTEGSRAGFDGTVVANGSRTISITGAMTITRGTFSFPNTASVTNLSVGGSLAVASGATMSAAAGGTANVNLLSIAGGISNAGTINFRNTALVDVTFTGTSDATISGAGTTTFDLVTINKGANQTPKVTLNTSGTVNTTAAAGGWLILENGTFEFANTNTFATTLSTTSYTIPSTTKLRVSTAGVTVNTTSGDNDDYDLFLYGGLEMSNGTVNVGNTTVNTENIDIEYASVGVPSITVSGGSLWVKSAIRRSTTTIAGALSYTQSAGVATIGGISTDEISERGVFEIDYNTGSNFTLSGSSQLIIERSTGLGACATSYADLYINPVTASIAPGSSIILGLATAGTPQNIRVDVVPAVGNFTIRNGGGTSAQDVYLFNDLVVAGALTVPTPSSLNATCVSPNVNVTVAGNFNCGGTYDAGTNTTYFNGTSNQTATLSANTDFYNVTISKAAGTTIDFGGVQPTAPAINDLQLLTGTLDVGTIDLTVNRNITINSNQIGASKYVVIYSTPGVSNTITSSGGSFTNLRLAGTAGTTAVAVAGNLTINGNLNFGTTYRYLMIGPYSLTFSTTATAITGSGSTAFIRTNGVASDLGVIKNWSTGVNQTFAYQVGTAANWTPATINLSVTTGGSVTVIPVNSAHLTRNQTSGERILNYYWTVKRDAALVATLWNNPSSSLIFSYPSSLITGSSVALNAAYLNPNSNPLGWTTNDASGSASTTTMTFNNTSSTNFPPAGANYFDYSVGTGGGTGTLPNPIQPLYSRLNATVLSAAGGDWGTAANWTTQTDGDPNLNDPVSSIAPVGVPVVILPTARINTTGNGRRAFRIIINGILSNGTDNGHNLGTISGTGTFRTSTNTFPAGNYTAFVATGGGTIEYELTTAVPTLTMNSINLTTSPGIVTYNNVSARLGSGSSGTLSMATAEDMVVNGNLTLPVNITLSNGNNRNISIAGNWTDNGTFNQGTGNVTFNGSTAQTIAGSSDFVKLTIAKPSTNVTLNSATNVTGLLTMTNGHIVTTATNLLQMGLSATVTGASDNSFVSGPMTKLMASGNSFDFPTGSIAASRYRYAGISAFTSTETWTVEYVGNDPGNQSYPNENMLTPLQKVSNFEYWMISRTGSASANVTLSYNTGSYDPAVGNVGNMANLRVARWVPANSQWEIPPGATTFTPGGNNIQGTITAGTITAFSPITIASLDNNSPLPVNLLYFRATPDQNKVELSWATATEKDNHFFTVEKTLDFETFHEVGRIDSKGDGSIKTTYSLTDNNPYQGRSYYRLKQTDHNGDFTYSGPVLVDYDGPSSPILNVYPNPFDGNVLRLEIVGVGDTEEVPIIIYDQKGQKIYSSMLNDFDGAVVKREIVFAKPLASGVYVIKAGKTLQLTRKILVE